LRSPAPTKTFMLKTPVTCIAASTNIWFSNRTRRNEMKRKRKKTKGNRKWVIAAVIIVTIFVVIAAASYLNQQSEPPKKEAKDYFRVVNATINDADPVEMNDTTILSVKIYGISFMLQAVGGDAHDVAVMGWAYAQTVPIGIMSEGEFSFVTQMSPRPYGIYTEINEEGKFSMEIRIISREAEGKITIYF